MIRLAVALTDSKQADAYRRAARRLRDVVLVDGIPEADAVVTDDHEEASSAERHVLLEGVTGATGPRLEELAEKCRSAARCLMPAHAWRFRPSVRAVRDALDAGKLGESGLLRIHRWTHPTDADSAENASTQIISEIDLANWFFGGRPREIYAVARDGYLQIHLGFADGGMALIDHAALPAGDEYRSLSLIGSTGACYADDHRDLQLCYAGGAPTAVSRSGDDLAVVSLVDEFASAIREARPPSVTVEATAAALAVFDGVTSAARERRVARPCGETYELD